MKFLTHSRVGQRLKTASGRLTRHCWIVAALGLTLVLAFKASEQWILARQQQAVQQLAQEMLQALMVNDAAQVQTLMASLAKQPGVATAELVSDKGASLASFARAGQPSASEQSFALASLDQRSGVTHTTIPLRFDGMVVAQLNVALHLWPVVQRALTWVGLGLCVLGTLYAAYKYVQRHVRWDPPSTQAPFFDVQHALPLALAQAQISVKFQPVCRISDGAVVGMNVRVCWPQSSGELLHLSPAEFVAQAREADMFLPFGEWVFETVWTQAAKWQRAHGPLTLAFDMSAQERHAWGAMGQGVCLGAPLDANAFSALLQQRAATHLAEPGQCATPWPASRASAA